MPMDRLLCGDVGYGKTEVAMRATFKAVMDGKQVAVLAPTTVLVFQHLHHAARALCRVPGRIDMMSAVSIHGRAEGHPRGAAAGKSTSSSAPIDSCRRT